MSIKLQLRRGLEINLPNLAEGEPGFCTDSHKLFIGSAAGNKGVAMLASPIFTGDINLSTLLGTEVVTNGTFTGSGTGWTLGSFAYDSNNIKHVNGGGTTPLFQTIAFTANTWYKLQITVSGYSGSGTFYPCQSPGGWGGPYLYSGGVGGPAADGTFTWYFYNIAGSNLYVIPEDALVCHLDNITCRPLTTGDLTIGRKLTALELSLTSHRLSLGDPAGNLGMGEDALIAITSAYTDIAIGKGSQKFTTSGHSNTSGGVNSLGANTIGYRNNAHGKNSLLNNTEGYENVADGVNSLLGNTIGHNLTGVGWQTLVNSIIASGSVALGSNAGYHETGSNKLFIDNAQRTNEADGRIKALIYGVFDALTANQRLSVNARLLVRECPNYANNTAALAGGLVSGELYTVTGTDPLQVARVI